MPGMNGTQLRTVVAEDEVRAAAIDARQWRSVKTSSATFRFGAPCLNAPVEGWLLGVNANMGLYPAARMLGGAD